MKKRLEALLRKKQEEKTQLVTRSEETEDLETLKTIHTELEKINEEIVKLQEIVSEIQEDRQEEEDKEEEDKEDDGADERTAAINKALEKRGYRPGEGFEKRGAANFSTEKREKQAQLEKRGKALKEERSVKTSSDIVLPIRSSSELTKPFSEVSSIVDLVSFKPLYNGESYEVGYVIGYGEAGNTGEGEDSPDTETKFGRAEMKKTKISAYSEYTEEMEKLPEAAYAQEIEEGNRIAIRKKVAAQILDGDGSTNNLTGIFHSNTIQADEDIEIAAIDDKTLDEIIFSYGGDEEVEDSAVLILNKKDLKAFSQLRTKDGKKLHTIVANGNTGTIDGTKYVIHSKCKAISDQATTAGQYCMAYGSLSQYQVAVFSDIEIKRSSEYQFRKGMIAFRGTVFLGGNVVKHNGFLRIKKGAAPAAASFVNTEGQGSAAQVTVDKGAKK